MQAGIREVLGSILNQGPEGQVALQNITNNIHK